VAEAPEVFVFDESSEAEAALDLAERFSLSGMADPIVVASVHGTDLASAIAGITPLQSPPPGADQAWASQLGSVAIKEGAGAIVAVGGGRCLDLGKLAAARAGLSVFAVPTQLSHDGICSPVAAVPNDDGRAESVGAVSPRVVYLSIPTLIGAPTPSVIAGVGDLLANPLSLRDWALAAERGLEEIDQRAWDLSVESFAVIEPYLGSDPEMLARDPEFLKTLAHALVLSGTAMIYSGTSRPASGAEHEISHAIDHLFPGRAMHGAQVAFGAIFSVALYEEDTNLFREKLSGLGLPQHPDELGLSFEDVVQILLEAPDTRPGRFTVLESANLDRSGAESLTRRIWG
jgi:glycerol-1-phosphate dehydrogenase [NAD(P)+]